VLGWRHLRKSRKTLCASVKQHLGLKKHYMKLKKNIILCLLLISGKYAISQTRYFGIKLGVIPSEIRDPFSENPSYLIGIRGEFAPKNAVFALSTEIQYIPKTEIVLTPIGLNFRLGRRTKFRTMAGILPILNLGNIDPPNKWLTVGAVLGIGIEIPASNRLSIITESGLYFIPNREHRVSPGGAPYTYSEMNHGIFLSVGIQYQFGQKE
jgi:hypothetical protein